MNVSIHSGATSSDAFEASYLGEGDKRFLHLRPAKKYSGAFVSIDREYVKEFIDVLRAAYHEETANEKAFYAEASFDQGTWMITLSGKHDIAIVRSLSIDSAIEALVNEIEDKYGVYRDDFHLEVTVIY